MEKKIRIREEVEAQIRAKNSHADNEVVEALTTLSLTVEEQEESAAEKAASKITAKFHGLISKSIWDE